MVKHLSFSTFFIVFYNLNDHNPDTFYLVLEGQAEIESTFELEYIFKRPLDHANTEWKYLKETR